MRSNQVCLMACQWFDFFIFSKDSLSLANDFSQIITIQMKFPHIVEMI